jgi:RHS repeat-associated protein
MWRQGEWYRLIKDVRGSVRLVVSIDDGSIAQRLSYDAFGRVTADSSPGFQPFGFAGGIYDHRTQLVLFGFRSYDPLSGRFLSRDPLWHGGGHSNLYLYVANDPVNFVDPDGLWAVPVWVAPVIIATGVAALIWPSKDGSMTNIFGKAWSAPNTAIGVGHGVFGMLRNAAQGVRPEWGVENNAIVFYNHPVQRAAGAGITMGNVICYKEEKIKLDPDVAAHERQHTYQGEKLGPFYFPAHLALGGFSLAKSIYKGDSSSFNTRWHDYNYLEDGPSNTVSKSPWD